MSLNAFKILLVISILLSVGIVGMSGYQKVTGKNIVSTTSITSCNHESYWQKVDKNGNTYCQSCSIDERLRLTLPDF